MEPTTRNIVAPCAAARKRSAPWVPRIRGLTCPSSCSIPSAMTMLMSVKKTLGNTSGRGSSDNVGPPNGSGAQLPTSPTGALGAPTRCSRVPQVAPKP